MKTLQNLATALRNRITSLRLTQEALSAQAGVSRQTLSKVLSGRTDLKVTTLFALADRLDLEVMLVPKEIGPSMMPVDDTKPHIKSAVQAAVESIGTKRDSNGDRS